MTILLKVIDKYTTHLLAYVLLYKVISNLLHNNTIAPTIGYWYE